MSNINELTLLYVEDDHALREQFVRVLTPKFKQVFEAADGAHALEIYEQYTPDMMVVDINLPKIDGLDVIEKVRKNNETIPIVILSAYSDQEKLLRAIKLGLSDYLIKPVPHKKLLAILDEMVLKYEKLRDKKNVIKVQNGYLWDKNEKSLSYCDAVIALTKREMLLLDLLFKQINKIVTRESIANVLWEHEESTDAYSALSHLLKRLRKKLPKELIDNIYGEGYRITSG